MQYIIQSDALCYGTINIFDKYCTPEYIYIELACLNIGGHETIINASDDIGSKLYT